MADNENSDLTQEPVPSSIQDIIARAMAQEENSEADSGDDALPVDQDGPADDAGELSDDDGAADPDDSETEDEDTEEVPEAPAAEEPPADPAPDEPAPDPRELEISRLKDLVSSGQETVNRLTEVLTQQGLAVAQPRAPEAPRVSEAALELALFGRPDEEEAWKALSPHERAAATKKAREHQAREARFAQDPSARYQDFRKPMLEDVYRLLEPIVQDFYKRQAEDAYREVAGSVKDPVDKKRLADLYRSVPGSKNTVSEQREALKLAAQILDVEKKQAELAKDRQKVDAKRRDRGAVEKAKNKPINSGGRRSAAPDNKTRPAWKPGEDWADYAARLQTFESGG